MRPNSLQGAKTHIGMAIVRAENSSKSDTISHLNQTASSLKNAEEMELEKQVNDILADISLRENHKKEIASWVPQMKAIQASIESKLHPVVTTKALVVA